MLHKTFLSCLLLMLPSLFMGQVLQEINPAPTGLSDPDEYPLEVYFKVGQPIGSISVITGYKNMNQILQDEGIERTRFREMNTLEVGLRYTRFFAEVGFASEFFNSPISSFTRDRFAVNFTSATIWANLGYAVWQDRNSALILRLGIGGAAASFDIRPLRNMRPVDFDGLFAEGAGNPATIVYHENAFWDIGIEWWKGRAKKRVSFGEVIKIGYRRGINETAWQASNTTALNAPLDRMGEVYLNLGFHLGRTYFPQN